MWLTWVLVPSSFDSKLQCIWTTCKTHREKWSRSKKHSKIGRSKNIFNIFGVIINRHAHKRTHVLLHILRKQQAQQHFPNLFENIFDTYLTTRLFWWRLKVLPSLTLSPGVQASASWLSQPAPETRRGHGGRGEAETRRSSSRGKSHSWREGRTKCWTSCCSARGD